MATKASPYFSRLIEHIDQSWLRLKGINYPFAGRDFRDLKGFCRSFQEWGLMALWDAFVASQSEWVKKSGYSIGAFVKCLPWLVDDPGWKLAAKKYQLEIEEPLPTDLFTIVDRVVKKPGG